MPIRRLLIALIIILTSETLFAAGVDTELEKWLLKSKRADLRTYTVISNDTYSTRLFVATDDKTKVTIARDDATGLTSLSVDGKCQLFFYRKTVSGYRNVSYFSDSSFTGPIDAKHIAYSPQKDRVIVTGEDDAPIKDADIKNCFRSLFYRPCKAVAFQPTFDDAKSWPMPEVKDADFSRKLLLDDLIVRARSHELKHFHVIVSKKQTEALVLATSENSLSVVSDDDGLTELSLQSKAIGVLLHSNGYTFETIPPDAPTGPVEIDRFAINDAGDGITVEYQTSGKTESMNLSDDWIPLLLSKPTVHEVDTPALGDYQELNLPYKELNLPKTIPASEK